MAGVGTGLSRGSRHRLYKRRALRILPRPCNPPRLSERRWRLQRGNLMYAVIKTGGKQYRVATGDKLRVEKLAGNVGDAVVFDQVLLLGGETVKLGTPVIGGAKVEAKILGQELGKKLIVFKFRRRKN